MTPLCYQTLRRIIFLLVFSWSNCTWALAPLVVAQGQEKVLVSASEGKMQADATIGSLINKANPEDPKKWDLVYTAPANAAGKTVTVHYGLPDGPLQAVSIDIVEQTAWGEQYGAAFKTLFTLFVVATVLESALALVFNWSVFLRLFDARGSRTIFSFGGALWLVLAFDLDLLTHLINVLWNPQAQSDAVTNVLSAMVLAGGSSGVNRLMVNLGFREVRTVADIEPQPPNDVAWLSVRLVPEKDFVGPVVLSIQRENGPILGLHVFNQAKDWRPRLLRWMLRDRLRFPSWGGYPLDPTGEYTLYISWKDSNETKNDTKEGPFQLSPRAIYDLEMTPIK